MTFNGEITVLRNLYLSYCEEKSLNSKDLTNLMYFIKVNELCKAYYNANELSSELIESLSSYN